MPAHRLLSLLFCAALFSLLQNSALAQSSLPSSAQPRSLAAGDFHGDGTIDLISGFGDGSMGFVVLHRANLDAQTPAGRIGDFRARPTATGGTPFQAAGDAIAVPVAPDFLGVGDFNNDGRLDLVLAAHGGNAVYLLPGDGRGGFGAAQRIGLPGAVTAFVTGEINRADGLADFVVGVNAPEGARAMVFESPLGAWRAQPEVFSLPGAAESMALGRFRGNYTVDLAVAVGSQVVFIEGRDRKLILDESLRPAIPSASVSRLSFPLPISSLAKGDFEGTGQEHLGVLLTDGSLHRAFPAAPQGTVKLQATSVWESAELASGAGNRAAKMLTGRVSGLGGDDLILLDAWNRRVHVQPTGPSASRTSIDMQAEPVAALAVRTTARARSQLVVLQVGQTTPTQLTSATDPIFTVTNVSDSGAGSLRQAIMDANANTSGNNAINFNIPGTGPFTIKPATVLPFVTSPGTTIDATTQPGATVRPMVTIDGSAVGFNNGIVIQAPNCGVKGLSIINFQLAGISAGFSSGGATISGNLIGISLDGVTNGGNGTGVFVITSLNTITGNVISGNKGNGVELLGGGIGNTVSGNLIGVDANGNGTAASANALNGVSISSDSNFGVSSMNTIGGTNPGDANVISGNTLNGVLITSSPTSASTGNVIEGNFIGTDHTGTKAVPNKGAGVFIDNSPNNMIGGLTAGAKNVITGNSAVGAVIGGGASSNNIINGNFLGTSPLGNAGGGMTVGPNASNNIVGGSVPNAGNTISGNTGDGVDLAPGAFRNVIAGNTIKGNTASGIFFSLTSEDRIDANLITKNLFAGAHIDSGSAAIQFTQNSIFDNAGPPIVIDPGGNLGINTAHITSATNGANSVTVQGTLSGVPAGNYVIEVFGGPTSTSAGKIFLGQTGVTVGPSGPGTFSATFSIVGGLPGGFVTATVTDSITDTSAYAAAVQVQAATTGPTISSVTPTSGPPLTPVSIGGAGLSTVNFVAFGSLTSSFTVLSDFQINTSVPAAAIPGSTSIVIGGPNGTATAPFTVTAPTAPAITSANNATFTVGMNGTFTITTTGSPVPSVSIGGTPPLLPTGVTLIGNRDGTATIVGTPVAGSGGVYTFTVEASNGTLPNARQTFTLTVNEAPTITSANNTTFTVGTPGSFTVRGFGFPLDTITQTGILPIWAKFVDNGNDTATLSGTPTAGSAGPTPLILHMHNLVGPDAMQPFTLNVAKDATTTALSSSPSSSVFGQQVIFTAHVAASGGVAIPVTDAVTFTDSAGLATLGVVATDSAGNAAVQTSSLSVGSHTITAKYGGDINYTTSLTSVLEKVNPAEALLVVDCPPSQPVGVPFNCPVTGTAVAPSTAIVSGTINFKLDAGSLSTAPIVGGHSSISLTLPSAGPHTLNVNFLPNANFNAFTVPPITINGTTAGPILLTSSDVSITASGLIFSRVTGTFNGTVTIKNIRMNATAIPGPLQLVLTALPAGVTLANATGTFNGGPFITFPSVTSLSSGQSATVGLQFKSISSNRITFIPFAYSGTF